MKKIRKKKKRAEKVIALFLSLIIISSFLVFVIPIVSARGPSPECTKQEPVTPKCSDGTKRIFNYECEDGIWTPLEIVPCPSETPICVGDPGEAVCEAPSEPAGPLECNVIPDPKPKEVIVNVKTQNAVGKELKCSPSCGDKSFDVKPEKIADLNQLVSFTISTAGFSEGTQCNMNCYVNSEICHGNIFTVGKGATTAPSTPSQPWWKIPCLRFKEPGPMPGKWGPFTSWVDITWTVFSALYAFSWVRGLDTDGTCIAEQPYDEDDNCEACEEDPYRICTKDRCEILGHNCFAVEREDDKGYHCFEADCDDDELAKINKIEFKWYVGLSADLYGKDYVNGNQLIVSDKLPWNVTHAILNIEQDKEAKCRYVIDQYEADFADMINFDDNEMYSEEQSVDIALNEVKLGEHYIFIKCRNKCNTINSAQDDSNYVKFEIDEIPEGIPPIIEYIEPETGYISDSLDEIDVSLWLNENGRAGSGDEATCKYSTIAQELTDDWSEMIPFQGGTNGQHPNTNNSVIDGSCINNQQCRYIQTGDCAHCSLTLDLSKGFNQLDVDEILEKLIEYGNQGDITAEELAGLLGDKKTKMYPFLFRCQDVNGNKNSGDYYTLIAIPPYKVKIVSPEEGNETYEREIDLEVNTTSYEGIPRQTFCRYKLLDGLQQNPNIAWSDLDEIDDVLTDYHTKTIEELDAGTYTMYVKCRDLARIEVSDYTRFKILEDTNYPIVIRMYHHTTAGDYLIIETNEPSECVYGIESCNYNFSDGSSFITTEGYLHAAYWKTDNLYYVKCKDKWDNYPDFSPSANVCTVIINPYEVPSF